MTGFDSESDRRDAVRKQIVDECVFTVRENIRVHGATNTHEERRWLELTVACNLLQGLQREAMSDVYRQEIEDAGKKLGDDA
jgi:hypothetical protein